LLPQRQPEAFEEEALGANSVARPSNAFKAVGSMVQHQGPTADHRREARQDRNVHQLELKNKQSA
jgi:hypothetical protein